MTPLEGLLDKLRRADACGAMTIDVVVEDLRDAMDALSAAKALIDYDGSNNADGYPDWDRLFDALREKLAALANLEG